MSVVVFALVGKASVLRERICLMKARFIGLLPLIKQILNAREIAAVSVTRILELESEGIYMDGVVSVF